MNSIIKIFVVVLLFQACSFNSKDKIKTLLTNRVPSSHEMSASSFDIAFSEIKSLNLKLVLGKVLTCESINRKTSTSEGAIYFSKMGLMPSGESSVTVTVGDGTDSGTVDLNAMLHDDRITYAYPSGELVFKYNSLKNYFMINNYAINDKVYELKNSLVCSI